MPTRKGSGDREREVVEAAIEELKGDIDDPITDRMHVSSHTSSIGDNQSPKQLEEKHSQVLLLKPLRKQHDLVPYSFLLPIRDIDHCYYKSIQEDDGSRDII